MTSEKRRSYIVFAKSIKSIKRNIHIYMCIYLSYSLIYYRIKCYPRVFYYNAFLSRLSIKALYFISHKGLKISRPNPHLQVARNVQTSDFKLNTSCWTGIKSFCIYAFYLLRTKMEEPFNASIIFVVPILPTSIFFCLIAMIS